MPRPTVPCNKAAETTTSALRQAHAGAPLVPGSARDFPRIPETEEQRASVNRDVSVPDARERTARREHVPLGITYMVSATILFAASSAVSKWLVARYPIGE